MLFRKSKSKTLRILNFVLLLSVFFWLTVLIGYLIDVMFPQKYDTFPISCPPWDICPAAYESNFVDNIDIAATIAATLVLILLVSVIFVCNKWNKLFDVSKPSGLKILTAISILIITEIGSFVLFGIVVKIIDELPL